MKDSEILSLDADEAGSHVHLTPEVEQAHKILSRVALHATPGA